MLGTTIVVLTTHRHTRRQIARALMSGGSTTHFVESLEELNRALVEMSPSLLILDADNSDAEIVERVLPPGEAPSADGPAPVILLSVSKDKRPLQGLVDRHDLSNLVAKHGAIRASYPVLDERELVVTCEKVLQRNIFGIDKYVGHWGVVLHHAVVTGAREKAPFLARFEEFLNGLDCPRSVVPDIITVADELIMNAIVHAPRDAAGNPKYEDLRLSPNLVLEPHEYVNIAYGCDGQRLMLSVTDNFGTLDKRKLQSYLSRAFGPPLTPEAKPSGAGIGLSMSFRSIHQLIFNVQESKRTEAIAGWYLRVNSGAEFRQVGKSLNMFWLPKESSPLVEHTASSSVAIVYMPPKIDESTDFTLTSQAVVLDMRGVKVLTSRGFLEWMKFLGTVAGRNIMIEACPQALIRQAALVAGALAGVTVRTVLAPFECTACGKEQEIEMAPERVLQPAVRACTSCGAQLSFAGLQDEYEGFLQAIRKPVARA